MSLNRPPKFPYSTRVPFTLPGADRSLLASPDSVEKFAGQLLVLPQDATASARVNWAERAGKESQEWWK